jgi:hypothetical protein
MNRFLLSAALLSSISLSAQPLAGLEAGGELNLDLSRSDARTRSFLGRGWWDPERDGRWTGRDRLPAELLLPVAAETSYEVMIFTGGIPAAFAGQEVRVRAFLNGEPVGEWGKGAGGVFQLALTADRLQGVESPFTLTLETPLFCPQDLGTGPDDRDLGLKVSRVRVLPFPETAAPADGVVRVAVFRDAAAPLSRAASSPDLLVDTLARAGVAAAIVDAEDLGDPRRFGIRAFDVLVLPYGGAFPEPARENFLRFLRRGGGFVSMGGYAFSRLYGGRLATPILRIEDFEPGLAEWRRDVPPDADIHFEHAVGEGRDGSDCVRVTAGVGAPVSWYGLSRRLPDLPAGTTLQVETWIRTRELRDGFGAYPSLAFLAADGRRLAFADGRILSGTSPWTRSSLGGTVPDGTAEIRFSFLIHGRGEAWYDDLEVRHGASPMNTAEGRAADFLEVEVEQIGAFDAGYPLTDGAFALPDPHQHVLQPGLRVDGPLSGWAAIGTTGAQWYCTCTDRARLVPLLQTYDRYGRRRGPLATLIHHFTGPYTGSSWALFGADNVDLFTSDRPEMLKAFVDVVRGLRQRVCLHETASDLACYRQGEGVELRTHVFNGSGAVWKGELRFQVSPAEGGAPVFETAEQVLIDTGSQEISVRWEPERFGSDLYRITTSLVRDGVVLDEEATNGFAVWTPETFAALPRVRVRDHSLWIGDRRQFVIGGQQFWSSHSALNSSPLVIAEDFRLMRDFGVRLNRSFMMWALRPEQEERRFRDMMVYLAHRYGVLFFYEGIAESVARTDDFGHELARARFVADRYGDLPLFMVDLRNEPSIHVAPGERQNGWLRAYVEERYGGEPPYPFSGVQPLSNGWGDLRSYDTASALLAYQRNWSRTLAGELRRRHPSLAVSVGYLQENSAPGVVKDPSYSADGLDFMNRHFYGPLPNFPPQFKETDLRTVGMPPSVGEFGSKTHPSGGGNYESREDQFTRYEFITHYAFGLGGIFVSNWHWRDPWENIFPYGVMHQDNVPKPIAKVYRAMGLMLGTVAPVSEVPPVVVVLPDEHRVSYLPLSGMVYNALNTLMDLRVDFTVVRERDIARLPQNTQAVFYPLPFLVDDAVVSGLGAYVEQGGVLYLSGDLAYDPLSLEPTRADALDSLLDGRTVTRLRTGMPDLREDPVTIAGLDPRVGGFSGFPLLTITPGPEDEILHRTSDGEAISVVVPRGSGEVVFTGTALEARSDGPPDSGLYALVLERAGVRPNGLVPADAPVHVFRVPSTEGQALVVYDRRAGGSDPDAAGAGQVPFTKADVRGVTLSDTGLSLGLAPMKPGFVHVADDSRLLAIETQGAVTRDGKTVLETGTHVLGWSLDGQDLTASRALALVALYPGRVRLAVNGGTVLTAEAGEIAHGAWRRLCPVALGRDGTGGVELVVDEGTAGEVILVAVDMAEARDALLEVAGFEPAVP